LQDILAATRAQDVRQSNAIDRKPAGEHLRDGFGRLIGDGVP
jgi:hypothetical protein